MTCRRTLSLLEDYLDRELPVDSIAEIDKHLESCESCLAKFSEAKSLIETLKNISVIAPEQEYQDQTVQLILARTSGSASQPLKESSHKAGSPAENIGFMRSIASFAVAVSVLMAAILIGLQSPNDPSTRFINQELTVNPEQFNASMVTEENMPFTQEEWNRLTGVMLMMGSPGLIRKSIIVTDLPLRSR